MRYRVIFYGCISIIVAVLLMVLVPAVRRACQRSSGPGHDDIGNLLSIGKAFLMYSLDHDGEFPPDWSRFEGLEPTDFVTRRNRDKAGNMSNVMEWTDYVFVTNLTANSPPDAILAYSPPRNYADKGGVILHLSGAVRWLDKKEFEKTLLEGLRRYRSGSSEDERKGR
jgi:hypothetical protein